MPKQNILVVFAHPDDESFGIGGTIAKLAEEYNVYLICTTDGNDPGRDEDLTQIRMQELNEAAAVLGIERVYFFDYEDGSLRNQVYHEIAEKIQAIVDEVKPFRLITFEPRGISGHLDHAAVSMITSFVFRENKDIREIWYACASEEMAKDMQDYFIYFPEGYSEDEVDLVIDTEDYWDTRVAAMKKHQSQLKDVNNIIERQKDLPKKEYFLVKSRGNGFK